MPSVTATRECIDALDMTEVETIGLFNQFREHLRKESPGFRLDQIVSRQPALTRCALALAKQTANALATLGDTGLDRELDCRRDDMAKRIFEVFLDHYESAFEETQNDAETEAFERAQFRRAV